MKFKWRYTTIPACITSGPFFLANMGGLGTGWFAPMLGSIMLAIGLGLMLDVIANQQKAINELMEQRALNSPAINN